VGLKEKVAETLRQSLVPEYLRLEDDGGVYGYVASKRFQRQPALERQVLVQKAFADSPLKFTKAELRRVLAIAPLTPAEYDEVGPKK
jgi:hypothetical protein